MIGLDERGPERAESMPGQRLVRAQVQDQAHGTVRLAGRATQAADDGRRGTDYLFGAFHPATGDVSTKPYERRPADNWADFWAPIEAWLPTDGKPVYAIIENLRAR